MCVDILIRPLELSANFQEKNMFKIAASSGMKSYVEQTWAQTST